MASPFPGMDPYLETRWGDIHGSLTIYSRDILNRSLPTGLVARSEVRSIVFEDELFLRNFTPDVSVYERGLVEPSEPRGAKVAIAESVCVVTEPEEIQQRFLEIRDANSGGRVVTVIEFVSPSNKRIGEGLDRYRQKQEECRDGGVNLVEIDLTRAGDRSLIMPVNSLRESFRSTYLAVVRRGVEWRRSHVYRLPLQKRLDGIPIPLRPTDRDVVLDLQALVDQAYENGHYDHDLTYEEELAPPLSDEEARWAKQLIADHRAARK